MGEEWSVEKRFRVTEVFLAILWVSGGSVSLRLQRLEWKQLVDYGMIVSRLGVSFLLLYRLSDVTLVGPYSAVRLRPALTLATNSGFCTIPLLRLLFA